MNKTQLIFWGFDIRIIIIFYGYHLKTGGYHLKCSGDHLRWRPLTHASFALMCGRSHVQTDKGNYTRYAYTVTGQLGIKMDAL